MSQFQAVLGVVLPVFLVAASGAVFARARPHPMTGLNDALFYVFVPALVFNTTANGTLSLSVLGGIALAAVIVSVGCAVLAALYLRARRQRSGGFVLAAMVPNNANMGMSLCALAFGDLGLSLATAFYISTALVNFTLGLYVASGGTRPLEALRVPLVYAALLGFLVRAVGLDVPVAIDRAVALLSATAIPGMLFSLGHRLSRSRLASLGQGLSATIVRLGGGGLLGWLAVQVLGLQGLEAKVVLVQAIMPSAVMTTVVAEKYEQDPGLVASAVALSTLVSLVVIPLVLSALM